MQKVSSAYGRAHLPELLQAVFRGERVTIERHRKPIAELVPPTGTTRPVPKFGTGKGKIIDPNWHKGPETDEELAAWLEGQFD